MSLPSRLLRLHLPASVSSCARSAPFLPAGRRPVLFLVRPDNPDQHLFHRNLTQEFPLQEITLLFFFRHFVRPPLYQHTQEGLSNMPLLSFSPDKKTGASAVCSQTAKTPALYHCASDLRHVPDPAQYTPDRLPLSYSSHSGPSAALPRPPRSSER